MATILKYNRNRHQFNLNIGGKHFVYRKDRESEVHEIDDWLVNKEPIENRLFVSFVDDKGNKRERVSVKTSGIQLWYNDDKEGKPDWLTFMWELPTKYGTLYLFSQAGCVLFDESNSGWSRNAVKINSSKVSIFK